MSTNFFSLRFRGSGPLLIFHPFARPYRSGPRQTLFYSPALTTLVPSSLSPPSEQSHLSIIARAEASGVSPLRLSAFRISPWRSNPLPSVRAFDCGYLED